MGWDETKLAPGIQYMMIKLQLSSVLTVSVKTPLAGDILLTQQDCGANFSWPYLRDINILSKQFGKTASMKMRLITTRLSASVFLELQHSFEHSYAVSQHGGAIIECLKLLLTADTPLRQGMFICTVMYQLNWFNQLIQSVRPPPSSSPPSNHLFFFP